VCPGVVNCFIRCGTTLHASFREINLAMIIQLTECSHVPGYQTCYSSLHYTG
jgi:predicted metal-binding protein